MGVPCWLDEPAPPLPARKLEGPCRSLGRLVASAILGRRAPEAALFDPERLV
jgi:hypothetical protein